MAIAESWAGAGAVTAQRPVRRLRPLLRPFRAPHWAVELGTTLSEAREDGEIAEVERLGYSVLRAPYYEYSPYNAVITVTDDAGRTHDYLARLGRTDAGQGETMETETEDEGAGTAGRSPRTRSHHAIGKRLLQVEIPEDLHALMGAYGRVKGMSRAAIAAESLREYLTNHGAEIEDALSREQAQISAMLRRGSKT